jgi:cell division protein FtsI/penicillin-binding protein 2
MEPHTGAILAMCGYPDFDPNKYNEEKDYRIFLNPVTQLPYEPGSVFKPITMAIGLELGLITPETTYQDKGQVKIGSYTLKNFDGKAHGINTMTQVLEQSLNTGAIFVAQKIGPQRFYDFVKKFGFGAKTGIELEGEAEGDISSLEKMKDIYLATASYGQGLTVTPLQLAQAFSVLANGGKLVKPHLVSEIIKPSQERIKITPQIIRQVISNKTATTISAMLVSVVEKGHGKRAGVPGYYVAGKTGTAQVVSATGRGYDPSRHIGSFVGFAPIDDPKFVMAIRIDDPKDVMWAESSAAPLFGEISQFLLNYFEVKPTR